MSESLGTSVPSHTSPVELLLPVGTKEMALAAIHHGADAIFMGVPGFNARGRSHDFEITELKEIIELCHLNGVRVNLAFNIVIFENEIQRAMETLEKILPLGPDAFIVQDLGLAQLIRKMAPHQRIHASTQMTVTNFEAIRLLQDLDMKRFVLGRENSIDEISLIRKNTDAELEVFVHGALCVSYSGQCFTSETLGGRSANRGQCAQSCRFSYDLIVDGESVDMGERKYLVSPQDLCGIEEVPALLENGVNSFKVEGRLKTPEYVATAAKNYREVIDRKISQQSLTSGFFAQAKKEMSTAYSRGFYSGWLNGVEHQKLVDGTFSSHRGYELGKIVDVQKQSFVIQLNSQAIGQDLKPGDGLLWLSNSTKGVDEQGGYIYHVRGVGTGRLLIEFSRDVELSMALVGQPVYQNHDKELKKQVQQQIDDKSKRKRSAVAVSVEVKMGEPLKVILTDGLNVVQGASSSELQLAKTKGVSDQMIEDEFSSLSGSVFKLQEIKITRGQSEDVFISGRELKELRQKLVADLELERKKANVKALAPIAEIQNWVQGPKTNASTTFGLDQVKLNILLREKGQVDDLVSAIESGKISIAQVQKIDTVTLDFEFGRDYAASLEKLRKQNLKVGLATTRILKPNEYRNLKVLVSMRPDSILVRNLGALQFLNESNLAEAPEHKIGSKIELRGDFSLNVTNHLTANYLLKKGLSTLCTSYDLNQSQVSELLQNSDSQKMEVTAFQYMPSFHMEHCVFAAFLSKGSSYKDCGKPCEKHDVRLKDQFGNMHQIKPDHECRNTMFNSKSQTAARFIQNWSSLGLGFIRYEVLKERGEELIAKISAHTAFLQGTVDENQLIQKLGAIESYGLSEGQLGRTKEYQSRKK